MMINLLSDYFRSLEVKSKERDVEKVIFSVLWEEALSYTELSRRMIRYPSATITKYLKQMVSDGTIQHKKNLYILNPSIKELLKTWQEKNEEAISGLQEKIKELEGWTYFMVEAARTSKDSMKLRTSFAKSVHKDIVSWYRSYYRGMFIAITGMLPAGIEKEMKHKCNLQLEMVEGFMKHVRDEDATVHSLISNPFAIK